MLSDHRGLRLIYDESSYQLVYMDVLVLAHLSNFLIKNHSTWWIIGAITLGTTTSIITTLGTTIFSTAALSTMTFKWGPVFWLSVMKSVAIKFITPSVIMLTSLCWVMDKLKLTGRNLGQVLYCRLARTWIGHAIVNITKQPNLKLKTQTKQLLGSLPLAFTLPSWVSWHCMFDAVLKLHLQFKFNHNNISLRVL